jgi:hypothetical protein
MPLFTNNHIHCGTAENSLPTTVYDLNHIDSLQTAVYIKEAVVQHVDENTYTFVESLRIPPHCTSIMCSVLHIFAWLVIAGVLLYSIGLNIYSFTFD